MNFINQKKFLQIKYWIYVISILLIIRILFNLFESMILGNETFFIDHRVSINAVKEFIEGRSPYGVGLPVFPFAYPPITLMFFVFVNEFLTPFLLFIYLLLILLFCLFFRKEPKIFIYSILVSIALLGIRRSSILDAMGTGNIGFFLHLIIITIWLFRKNFNTNIALYTAIAVATIIKPPIFLCYILLPLIAEAKISISKIIPGIITIIVVLIAYAIEMIMFPELFSNWMSGLISHEFGKTEGGMHGWSTFSLLFKVSNSYLVAIFGYIIISLLIIAFWIYYKIRYLDKIENTDFVKTCISIIPVVICIAVMPRIAIFDYTIMNFLVIYLLLKIKVFEINFDFIFESKISLLGMIAIFVWTIQLALYFVRLIQPAEIFSAIIGIWFLPILLIIIALIDRSRKIRLSKWQK